MDIEKLIRDEAAKAATEYADNLMGKVGASKELVEKALKTDKLQKKAELLDRIFANNGYVDPDGASFLPEKDKVKQRFEIEQLLNDVLAPADIPILMPKVISKVVREAVEPVMVLTALLNQVRWQGSVIEFPSVGGMFAAAIGPGQEYPTKELDMAGFTTAAIGKYGIQVRLTDEVIRYSIFDIVGLHLRAAGRALARLKEVNVANLILAQGMTSFNNLNPAAAAASIHGYTTGRDINTNGNFTLTIDDIFMMYADLVNAGFLPNTFIVNPIGWLIFARHSTLRQWAFEGTRAMYKTVQGKPGFVGPEGPNMGPSGASGPNMVALNQTTTWAEHPKELFPAALSMVVSPFVPYNATLGTTDIILCDRTELGILVTDEDPTTERWDDPARDIQQIKIRERYGTALNNEGEGITIARYVSTDKGFDWEHDASFPVGTGYLPPIASGYMTPLG